MCVIWHVAEFSVSSQSDLLPEENIPAYQQSIIHCSVCVWENQDTVCSVSCQAVQSIMCIKITLLWILVHLWNQSWFILKPHLAFTIYGQKHKIEKNKILNFSELCDTIYGNVRVFFFLINFDISLLPSSSEDLHLLIFFW